MSGYVIERYHRLCGLLNPICMPLLIAKKHLCAICLEFHLFLPTLKRLYKLPFHHLFMT